MKKRQIWRKSCAMSKMRFIIYCKKWFQCKWKEKVLHAKDCSRQFVENPQNKRISSAEWRIVENLLLERISLAGIARAGINLKKMDSGSMLKKNGMKSKKRRSTIVHHSPCENHFFAVHHFS